jgi:hypothetical protein
MHSDRNVLEAIERVISLMVYYEGGAKTVTERDLMQTEIRAVFSTLNRLGLDSAEQAASILPVIESELHVRYPSKVARSLFDSLLGAISEVGTGKRSDRPQRSPVAPILELRQVGFPPKSL